MNKCIFQFDDKHNVDFTDTEQSQATQALENGKVILFPHLALNPSKEESFILSPDTINGRAKNVSYNPNTHKLSGTLYQGKQLAILTSFMKQYVSYAKDLVENLFPHYKSHLQLGRTSFRPIEIKGRAASYRKDDTRLHVDAFVATPVNGLRILRVFCNINPNDVPRVWHLGETFEYVAKRFFPSTKPYRPIVAKCLHAVKTTKTLRTGYDHYMLQLHDLMKKDIDYQNTVEKTRFEFQPGSTWVVFTDQASHAALSGQYLLEQTFYVPVDAMKTPEISPLKLLESMANTALV